MTEQEIVDKIKDSGTCFADNPISFPSFVAMIEAADEGIDYSRIFYELLNSYYVEYALLLVKSGFPINLNYMENGWSPLAFLAGAYVYVERGELEKKPAEELAEILFGVINKDVIAGARARNFDLAIFVRKFPGIMDKITWVDDGVRRWRV